MNKKVSTIFAMAALAGGVFCGSAYAQETTQLPIKDNALTSVTAGKAVMLQDNSGNVLGLLKNDEGKTVVSVVKSTDEVLKSDVLRYTWNVRQVAKSQVDKGDYYIFENAVTGDTLSFRSSNHSFFIPNPNSETVADRYASENIHIFNYGRKAGETYKLTANEDGVITGGQKGFYSFEIAAGDTKGAVSIWGLTLTDGETDAVSLVKYPAEGEAAAEAPAITLFEHNTINVDVADLNALFNGYGFNFGVKPELANVAVDGNLFAGEDKVWAYRVDWDDKDANGNEVGYLLRDSDNNGEDLFIPNGVYFFTNPVLNSGTLTENLKPSQINWLASTLIAVSPLETEEGTDSDRANGAGFILKEVKGSDFIYYNNASVPEGNDFYITNACFDVQDNFADNGSYPYALSVPNFYYQKSEQYKGDDDQTKKTIYLQVTSYNNSRQSVVTATSGPNFRFNLSASSVIEGKTLLHDTKKAAIYTIKFISGNNDLKDKYLTVGNNVEAITDNGEVVYTTPNDFQFEAKGAAIYDETYPIFQFTITDVDGTNVEFTNRETGESFTAQLFKEDGENRYSLSVGKVNGAELEANQNMMVTPYTVERTGGANTYQVKEEENGAVKVTANLVVELKRLDNVDQYAGFLNAENKEIRTLAFARDVNDTSNKLYALVGEDSRDNYSLINDEDGFTNDIYEAAQWQLIKSSAKTITRVYVYNNTATSSIDDVPEGDKVSAYTYKLQYINDGEETGYYLPTTLTLSDDIYYNLDGYYAEAKNAPSFIIKENVDGSVSLINAAAAFQKGAMVVADDATTKVIELNDDRDAYDKSDYVYTSLSDAKEVKTYLDARPVEISWPAHEGHVTLKSELGNYINMNENRDGIVVNENDGDTYYLYVTDTKAVVPSFYITKGIAAENGERMFLFNPKDSVDYYVAEGDYDRVYQWAENKNKALFKAATINETRDTLTMTVKGETKYVAEDADDNDKNIWGGLQNFKYQIIEAEDAEGYYRIRQQGTDPEQKYLSNLNDKLTWSNKQEAMLFDIESVAAPTANEGVSATEVKIIATDGAINVKNAAGKNVVVSTILGQIVANEVLTSDNATISVPAGIVIVSVDGEEAVKVNVK